MTDRLAQIGPKSKGVERQNEAVQHDAVKRLSTVLKAIRHREIEAAHAEGRPMNKSSWASRVSDDLDVPEETFKNWLHADTFPEWPRLEKLVARFGAELRDAILPCADTDTDPLDDIENAVRRIRARGGQG